MHQWKNGLNWGWFRSIIDDYRTSKITKERFVREWQNAQEVMKTLNNRRSE